MNLSQISTYLILNVRSKRRLDVKYVPWRPPLALSGSRVHKIISIHFSWHTHPKDKDRRFKTFYLQATMHQLTSPIPYILSLPDNFLVWIDLLSSLSFRRKTTDWPVDVSIPVYMKDIFYRKIIIKTTHWAQVFISVSTSLL